MIGSKRSISLFIIFTFILFTTFQFGAIQKDHYKSRLININYANAQTLTKLPGIGKKKAERIISYRKKHGKFKRVTDIMKISGIGEKTFKKFAKKIKV